MNSVHSVLYMFPGFLGYVPVFIFIRPVTLYDTPGDSWMYHRTYVHMWEQLANEKGVTFYNYILYLYIYLADAFIHWDIPVRFNKDKADSRWKYKNVP